MPKDWIFKLKRRSYRKAFEKWFDIGNRLLWVENTLFILIGVTETMPEHSSRTQFWACDGEGRNFYKGGFWDIAAFGEIIVKGIVTERIRENMYPISEERFVLYLNIYDKMAEENNWGIRYMFSFDSVGNSNSRIGSLRNLWNINYRSEHIFWRYKKMERYLKNEENQRLEIIEDILLVATLKEGIKKAQIISEIGLDAERAEPYIIYLKNKGYIENNNGDEHKTTEKGVEFLRDYKKLKKQLSA